MRGDANSSVTFALSDGGGDVSLTVRAGHPVLALAVGGATTGAPATRRSRRCAARTFVGFRTGGTPQKKVELGGGVHGARAARRRGDRRARRDVVVAWGRAALVRRRGAARVAARELDRDVARAARSPRRPADAPLAAAGTAGGRLCSCCARRRRREVDRRAPSSARRCRGRCRRRRARTGSLLIAGLTATRVVVVTAEGRAASTLRRAAGASPCRISTATDAELIRVDGAGRLAVAAAPDPPRIVDPRLAPLAAPG
jgi:hypothetical protein